MRFRSNGLFAFLEENIIIFYLPRESASLKHFTKEPNGYKDSSLLRREWHFGGPQTSYSASLDVPLCSDVVFYLPQGNPSVWVLVDRKSHLVKKGPSEKISSCLSISWVTILGCFIKCGYTCFETGR